MGRSFHVRQGVNEIADRWERAAKRYPCQKRLVQIAKSYSSEGFMGCNDPLESVLFSAVMEIQKMYPNPSASVGNQDTPTNRNKPALISLVKPLHLMCAILVLTELVLHIHKDMYIFERIKGNRTKNYGDF